ncbi:DUF2254 domain-containing protein [Pontibacillus marinus]|uniref:DUF2254 domain-containing protein n=1 Tax=Pontibacillus marinus BH030004 = DSM 16465 TaxID=1385511 RepID=A0A0A5GFI3_9BACI|nr:DUF2254 domain-containing protein [Pontibacillus marinus]KGX89880.1 hypothetical protein N783_03225 [Pontibacillus marinus BH030004 = DSM 16465]
MKFSWKDSLFWIRIRDSYWFMPSIYSIFSIIAVAITTMVDVYYIQEVKRYIPELFLTTRSTAMSLYSALITSILTMTTISFSSIMVVLTTYSQQFSPRTLQDFMTDQVTQNVLGVYVFGFIFALLNLVLLTESKTKVLISPFFTVIVAIITLGFFVVFIHHSSRWVQVNNLIGKIQDETYRVIGKKFSEKSYGVYEQWDENEVKRIKNKERQIVKVQQSGYIQHVQFKSLIQWAMDQDVVIDIHFQVGDYVEAGTPLLSYYADKNKDEVNESSFRKYIMIGKERTNLQDIEFAIQKLVEIALRAISPGINDPHTAINCINRIGSLLAELGQEYKAYRYYSDQEDELRVILEPKQYFEYLYKSFYQIRLYGKNDVSVMNGVLEALYKIAKVNDEKVREVIWDFTLYMIKAIEDEQYYSYDYELIKRMADQIAEVCEKDPDQIPLTNHTERGRVNKESL